MCSNSKTSFFNKSIRQKLGFGIAGSSDTVSSPNSNSQTLMGESKESDAEDCFFDAFDEFPFHDCSDIDLHESTTESTVSYNDDPKPQLVQRRKSVTFDAPETSGRSSRLYPDLDEIEEIASVVEDDENASMSFTPSSVEEISHDTDQPRSNWVVKLVCLVFRSIWYLLRWLFSISTSPLWTLYHVYMFVTDPFSIKRRIRDYVIRKALNLWYPISRTVIRYAYERLKEQKIIWKLAKQLGWGVLWGLYVCLVMCVLLVIAVVVSGKVVQHVVERPVFLKESLNFDYTKDIPVSFVSVNDGLPLIPQNHKVQVGLTLTMPESDYNKKLGVFQVQVEAMSANGKTVAEFSRASMLQYKSMPIQLILTLLEMVPLVTGYKLESQTHHIKMGTFTEGALRTACFKVVVEGRAEFPSGAGVPEIYSAFITIESRHILLKRVMWYLKPILFLWIGFLFFLMELFFVLVFFRSVVLPRFASRDDSGIIVAEQEDQLSYAK